MSLKEYIKRNSGVIGILVGISAIIISFFISFYFYKKSVAKPEPILITDPSRILIVNAEHFSDTTLKVFRSDGNEVVGNITAIKFYFWNNGNKSIKASNILEPINMTLNDPNAVILDYKILKISRKIVSPKLLKNTSSPENSLSISFDILEEDDGISGQVIYSGKPDADLVVSGTIEDTKEILTNLNLAQRRFWSKLFKQPMFLMTFPMIFFIIFILFAVRETIIDFKKAKSADKKKAFTECILFSLLSIFFLIMPFVLVKGVIADIKREAVVNEIKNVPESIRP